MKQTGGYFFGLLFFSALTFFGQNTLVGTWIVSCPVEIDHMGVTKSSALCPTSVTDKSAMRIDPFEMTVSKDRITIDTGETAVQLNYFWSDEQHTVDFVYNESHYRLELFSATSEDTRLLKDQAGSMVILTRKH